MAAPGPAPPAPAPPGPAGPAQAAPHDNNNDDDPHGPVIGPWMPADESHRPYMPEWSDPGWREDIEHSVRGTLYRQHYVSTGGPLARPAVLPRDQGRNPTEFARCVPTLPPISPLPSFFFSLASISSRLGQLVWCACLPCCCVCVCVCVYGFSCLAYILTLRTHIIRRFGIYPKTRPTDPDPDVGRSLITPRNGGPGHPPPPVTTDILNDEEIWQSVIFGGPTSREVST